MNRSYEYSSLVEAARLHYENLKADINNASTRVESIRLTSLAQEALNLYTSLVAFEVGLVYSHAANAGMQSFGPMHE
jgi:hypothetical protein